MCKLRFDFLYSVDKTWPSPPTGLTLSKFKPYVVLLAQKNITFTNFDIIIIKIQNVEKCSNLLFSYWDNLHKILIKYVLIYGKDD